MSAKGFFIAGTDTGVGKTIVTACLLSLFKQRGLDVGVMKPIETGVDPKGKRVSDAEFLLKTANLPDSLSDVSPIRFQTPASPYQASLIENRPIDVKTIARKFRLLASRHQRMLAEGIGGILVPITRRYMVVDLVRDLGLPLIVVSRLALGAVNHALLTLRVAKEEGLDVRGVIFNSPARGKNSAAEKDYPDIVGELSGVPILGECPFIKNVSPESFTPDLLARLETRIHLNQLGEL